jgi:hypothetical protein
MNKGRKSILISIALLFFISAFMMLRQLMSHAYFSCITEDTFTYTSWAWQFIEALKEGIIYPRWLPLNFWGYGSPTFILYPPLTFYLAAFFNVFTGSVITAMNIAKFTALFLSGIGMFFLVREFYSEKIALLTASFCIVSPYYIFQFYFVGTFASTISFMWFAPVLLFTYRYIKNRQYRYIIYAGACYGGLILTHPINAYMFMVVLIAFIIYMTIVKKRITLLLSIPLIIITGLLISAAYVLPFIYEKQFLNMKFFIGEGGGFGFDFHNFYILPNLTNKFFQGNLWPVYYNTFVFFIFFFCILIFLFFSQIIKLRHVITEEDIKAVNKFFLCTAIGTLFLLFGISTFIWESIPYFEYIQFPVRWLNITAFAVAFLSAVTFLVVDTVYKTKRRHSLFIVLLFLICLILDYKYISTAHIFTGQSLEPVKAANWNLEHLPGWVNVKKIFQKDSDNKILITKGEGKADIIKWESAKRIIKITSKTPLALWIRIFNFPGWKSYIDGKQTEIKTEEGVGAMLIDVPEGKHTLVLKFVDTPVRYYAKIISIISSCVMALLVLFFKKTERNLMA